MPNVVQSVSEINLRLLTKLRTILLCISVMRPVFTHMHNLFRILDSLDNLAMPNITSIRFRVHTADIEGLKTFKLNTDLNGLLKRRQFENLEAFTLIFRTHTARRTFSWNGKGSGAELTLVESDAKRSL
jgi:hypothetical protein